jgi:hypothetical protein
MNTEKVLGLISLILVVGSAIIAFIDPTMRSPFTDLTKVAVGAYMGLLIPRR